MDNIMASTAFSENDNPSYIMNPNTSALENFPAFTLEFQSLFSEYPTSKNMNYMNTASLGALKRDVSVSSHVNVGGLPDNPTSLGITKKSCRSVFQHALSLGMNTGTFGIDRKCSIASSSNNTCGGNPSSTSLGQTSNDIFLSNEISKNIFPSLTLERDTILHDTNVTFPIGYQNIGQKCMQFSNFNDDTLLGPQLITSNFTNTGADAYANGINFTEDVDFANTNDDFQHIGVSKQDVLACISHEQFCLYQSLSLAFNSRNVMSAVSALRHMYIKQSGKYRIPNMLLLVMSEMTTITCNADTSLQADASSIALLSFTLRCVQWCFCGKRTDASNSFKYKMNRNIARWLMKAQERRGISQSIPRDVTSLAMTVAQSLIQSQVEMDFGVEILTMLKIPYFLPDGTNIGWGANKGTALPHAAADYHRAKDGVGATGIVGTLPQKHGNMIKLPGQSSVLKMQSAESVQDSKCSPMSIVEKRLVSLLEKSQKGILGAHIPAIYKEEYGEPLRLYGRKLKHVLLGTNAIEMLGGDDSSGGKRFRIISLALEHEPITPALTPSTISAGEFPPPSLALKQESLYEMPWLHTPSQTVAHCDSVHQNYLHGQSSQHPISIPYRNMHSAEKVAIANIGSWTTPYPAVSTSHNCSTDSTPQYYSSTMLEPQRSVIAESSLLGFVNDQNVSNNVRARSNIDFLNNHNGNMNNVFHEAL